MQVELATMLDAVQDTETKMVEMSALNHLMSTHVLQQAQQIQSEGVVIRIISPTMRIFPLEIPRYWVHIMQVYLVVEW